MDIREIKELIKFIEKSDIKEFQYENENESLYISKNGDVPVYTQQAMPQMQYAPMVAPAAPVAISGDGVSVATAPAVSGTEVKSPIVGTFYEAPSPGASAFVAEGDRVKAGQTLCIVEAMKIMNEIEAEFDCIIKKKVAQNGKPVEYGETIFVVEPV